MTLRSEPCQDREELTLLSEPCQDREEATLRSEPCQDREEVSAIGRCPHWAYFKYGNTIF